MHHNSFIGDTLGPKYGGRGVDLGRLRRAEISTAPGGSLFEVPLGAATRNGRRCVTGVSHVRHRLTWDYKVVAVGLTSLVVADEGIAWHADLAGEPPGAFGLVAAHRTSKGDEELRWAAGRDDLRMQIWVLLQDGGSAFPRLLLVVEGVGDYVPSRPDASSGWSLLSRGCRCSLRSADGLRTSVWR